MGGGLNDPPKFTPFSHSGSQQPPFAFSLWLNWELGEYLLVEMGGGVNDWTPPAYFQPFNWEKSLKKLEELTLKHDI